MPSLAAAIHQKTSSHLDDEGRLRFRSTKNTWLRNSLNYETCGWDFFSTEERTKDLNPTIKSLYCKIVPRQHFCGPPVKLHEQTHGGWDRQSCTSSFKESGFVSSTTSTLPLMRNCSQESVKYQHIYGNRIITSAAKGTSSSNSTGRT